MVSVTSIMFYLGIATCILGTGIMLFGFYTNYPISNDAKIAGAVAAGVGMFSALVASVWHKITE